MILLFYPIWSLVFSYTSHSPAEMKMDTARDPPLLIGPVCGRPLCVSASFLSCQLPSRSRAGLILLVCLPDLFVVLVSRSSLCLVVISGTRHCLAFRLSLPSPRVAILLPESAQPIGISRGLDTVLLSLNLTCRRLFQSFIFSRKFLLYTRFHPVPSPAGLVRERLELVAIVRKGCEPRCRKPSTNLCEKSTLPIKLPQ